MAENPELEIDPWAVLGYRIIEQIGKGGMGTVYRARQVSMDREVALKILPPRLAADKEYIRRFIQEARATGQLSHPHIVRVYDVGHTKKGVYYFSMELVEGQTLGDIMEKEGQISSELAIRILREMASALEHAARKGLVHRDVKPENILIDENHCAKLGDFGDSRRKASITGTLCGYLYLIFFYFYTFPL